MEMKLVNESFLGQKIRIILDQRAFCRVKYKFEGS